MQDAITAIHRLKREDFISSAAVVEPSQLVLLAQRVVCTVLEVKFDGPRPVGPAMGPERVGMVRRAYKELLLQQPPDSSLATQIAALDIVWLGARLNKEISELMSSFTTIVADDDFVNGIDQPLAEWAVVICLWLRRVSQVCSALDHSMYTSYAQRIYKHAVNQLSSVKLLQDRWLELIQTRARDPSPARTPTRTQLLSSPEYTQQGPCDSKQFISQFLQRGHGSPILADRVSQVPVAACNRIERGSLVMPQLG
eukprot:TRINITY_DN22204_c0_g1_i1.p1 TRINITY_DN22204_c0_g1~~TRINITY_DN22204_c0_g1_i1.p1  ORF type:complete len:254 (+),score=41.46 TRINITY_DN22204_c0_g1_i1:203-964(+)